VYLFPQDDLTNFCQGNGIPWLDDPSNENREFLRVAIRSSLTSAFSINKLTIQDLSLLMEMFTDANRRANCEVFNVITDQVHVKSAFGYAEVDITSISSLPVTTLNRLLTQLVKFSSGFPYPPSLKSIHKLLTSPIRGRPTQLVTQAIGGCLAFPLKRKHGNTSTLVVCRQPPERGVERREKVTVGSPLWWDGRFMIFGRYNCSNHGPVSQQQLLPTGCDQFYVRCMRKADFELLKWDESAQKALKSIPVFCQLSLPVICDRHSNVVVSIPHVGYMMGSPNVLWNVDPCPRHPLPLPLEDQSSCI
jgi:hypothetical protein